jgi:hypothetical protein
MNGDDGIKMHEALGELASAAETSVAFIREKIQPVRSPDPDWLVRLIAMLDSQEFNERRRAYQELEKLEELAGSAIRSALADKPSIEVQRRLEQLLGRLDTPLLSGAQLQATRVTTLLERIGTAEAKKVLEEYAKGAAAALLTREAKAALLRLEKR